MYGRVSWSIESSLWIDSTEFLNEGQNEENEPNQCEHVESAPETRVDSLFWQLIESSLRVPRGVIFEDSDDEGDE